MNIIENNKDKINKILDALQYCNFDQLENNDDIFFDQVFNIFKNHYEGNVDYAEGATKGVLIFKKI